MMEDSIVFQASISQFTKMMAWVQSHLAKYQMSRARAKQIELALEEALVNVIHYAYSKTPPSRMPGLLEIQVHYDQKKGVLDFVIIDQGEPFNPLTFSGPEQHPDIAYRTPGGLGIHFMKEVSDHIDYQRKGESNVLTIRNIVSKIS